MEPVSLAPVTPENRAAVLALRPGEDQRGFVPLPEESLAKAAAYQDTAWPFAVLLGDRVVGFLMLGYYAARGQYTLWQFLVDEGFQGRGIGRQAASLGLAWLRENFHPPAVVTGAREDNAAALHLYHTLDFQETGLVEDGVAELRLAWEPPAGVAVLGLNGAGKSTLAHALANQLGLFELDGEDYWFPAQREDRRWALDHAGRGLREGGETLPFSCPETKEAATAALLRDALAHPVFVLSSVRLNWGPELPRLLRLAVVLETPPRERQARLQRREELRFGPRVLPGGDMAAQQAAFQAQSAGRTAAQVEDSLRGVSCPVLRLDGTRPVTENLETIRRVLNG